MSKYISPTAWQLWQACGVQVNSKVQKVFWSDIVLYVKKNPKKKVFFEKLIKGLGIVGRNYDHISAPLPIIVKHLLDKSSLYSEVMWLNIIKEWTDVKLDLKLKVQAAILQKDDEVKKFVDEIIKGKSTPKQLVFKLLDESTLLRRYQKEDVILMLCSLISDRLKVDFEKREFDEKMAEGIFQVIEEPVAEAKEPLKQKSESVCVNIEQLDTLPIGEEDNNQLRIILGRFIYELKEQTPLQKEWDDVKSILTEAINISDNKIQEREEIIKRRRLLDEFKQNTSFITEKFSVHINNLGIILPSLEKVEELANEQLEVCVEALSGLKESLKNYQVLITESTHSLVDEKRRISLVLSSMTEIEDLVDVISKTVNEEKKTKTPKNNEVIDPMDTIDSLWQETSNSLEEIENSGQINLFS